LAVTVPAIARQKHFSMKMVLPIKTTKGIGFVVTPQLSVEHLLGHAESIIFIIKYRVDRKKIPPE